MMTNYETPTIDPDLISQIEQAILTDPEKSIKAILAAIEDDPASARRAGISKELIDLACGVDWECSSRDIIDCGVNYSLTRIMAIARFLAGRKLRCCNDIREHHPAI